MMPFKRIFEEKRGLVIPVAAALALNVILYFGVVYPMKARLASTRVREQTAARQLVDAEREDAAARELVQGRDRTDTALQAFYRDVLPNSLATARGMTYLHLAQLADQHHLNSSHRSATAETNAQGPLDRMKLTMALEGDYDDVRRFIYDLESGSPFIVIDSVTLLQGEDAGSPLQLTLALSTYYRHGA